jgi:adenine-specific DNA-methyltransferase
MGNVAKEGGTVFSNGKKPVRLISQLIRWANNSREGIILDFFAGSGTTAHAVMQANADDGGNRRFIMVQLDEVLDTKSGEAKEGYNSIADLSRQRIRRAGASIAQGVGRLIVDLDVGFRAFKIDTSNMRDIYYAPDAVDQGSLLAQVDNIKSDRTPEDLLFHVLVDQGVDLALPIAEETITGKKVFFVDGNALAACFDDGITDELVKEIAKRQPLKAVFRDANYGSDSVKINVDQIFRLLSPETEVKSL